MARVESTLYRAALLLIGCSSIGLPAVRITSVTASPRGPQPIGTPIAWTVTATDTNTGPLTFQFNVGPPGGALTLGEDFNVGTNSSGTWTSHTFVWAPTGVEGTYQIQVVAKDFQSGELATKTGTYQVNPLVTGSSPVVVTTKNPLVALFSSPSCAQGSSMRVYFQQTSRTTPASWTNWVPCHPPNTMTFEVAGMYPNTSYGMFTQTLTSGTITNGSARTFTTGSLPATIPFPTFKVNIAAGPQTDNSDRVLLHGLVNFGGTTRYPDAATDLSGKIIWYYYADNTAHYDLLTRPLPGGNMLGIQNGTAWNPAATNQQILRQFDLAGNTVRETNTGAIQQQLLAAGASDAMPCDAIPTPPPLGAACLNAFHHEAIQTLPNGQTAVLVSIEKIYPPGTQGDTSGLPVDILGDMIVVLDRDWKVSWYFDTFEHAGGAPQLDINRPAVRGETCVLNQQGCPPMFLLRSGVAPEGKDWLHANTIYYSPKDTDLLWSSKNQDWIMKVDYNGGTGTGNILWRMGPGGDFVFNNINQDPWPWFSGQHEIGMENAGAGPLTIFDNGDTRVSPQGVGPGNSRGMVLAVDEANRTVTPLLSADLGSYSSAGGSAQLLSNGNYFFLPAVVFVNLNTESSYSVEILPTAGTTGGTQVLNVQGPTGYRGWQLPSLYAPPAQ